MNKGISSTIKKKPNIIPLTTRLMTLQTGCQNIPYMLSVKTPLETSCSNLTLNNCGRKSATWHDSNDPQNVRARVYKKGLHSHQNKGVATKT